MATNNKRQGVRRVSRLAILSIGVLLGTEAIAQDNRTAEADKQYRRERMVCESMPIGPERTVCLREAAAARDAAKRGDLATPQSTYDRNALARCKALPVADRDSCVRRMRGEGETRGSVAEGGIYREYKEIQLPEARPDASGSAGTMPAASSSNSSGPGDAGASVVVPPVGVDSVRGSDYRSNTPPAGTMLQKQ